MTTSTIAADAPLPDEPCCRCERPAATVLTVLIDGEVYLRPVCTGHSAVSLVSAA